MDVLADVLEKGEFRSVGSDITVEFTAQFIASSNDIARTNSHRLRQ